MSNSLQILNSLTYTGTSNFSAAKIISSKNGSDYLNHAISSWNTISPPLTSLGRFTWSQVEFVNDKFFTTVTGKPSAAWSYDGKNWNSITVPMTALKDGIAYGGGMYTGLSNFQGATTYMTPESYYSTDGINWSINNSYNTPIVQLNWATPVYGVVNGTGIFVSVGGSNTSGYGAYSYDGINWTFNTSFAGGGGNSIAYGIVNGQGIFVTVPPHSATYFMYSTDGVTWKQGNSFTSLGNSWSSVTYGYNDVGTPMFVAVSNSTTGYPANVLYSYDGKNWAYGSIPDYYWINVIYTPNGLFIATATTSTAYGIYAYSYDGITFNTAPYITASYILPKIAYGNGVVVAAPYYGAANQFAYATLPVITSTGILTH